MQIKNPILGAPSDAPGADAAGPPPKPQQQLVRSLIHLFGHLKHTVVAASADSGLPVAGFGILRRLRDAPERTLRASELAAAGSVTPSTISRQLVDLEESGLVARSADPDDRRASRVTITAQGLAVLERLLETSSLRISEQLADWDDADVLALSAGLDRLAADLDGPQHATDTKASTD